jgi:release factor glutamine methyltransferase
MTSIRAVLLNAQVQLNEAPLLDAIDARYESQLLLQHALKVNRAWLIAHESDDLAADIQHEFNTLMKRRIGGEPIAYILGNREFYGLNLAVTPATLIPRPDTEILVDIALEKIQVNQPAQVLDLGTGTGAIALAIAQQRPQVQVTGVDASKPALEIAISNSQQLHITNSHFILSDWFNNLNDTRFDVIVSNPPYIEEADAHLKQGDLRFEPISALASGADGLDDIRRIIDGCLIHLKPQGWLMFEHGYNQAEIVRELMARTGLVAIETFKDLGGNDRVTIGKNPLIVSTHWD